MLIWFVVSVLMSAISYRFLYSESQGFKNIGRDYYLDYENHESFRTFEGWSRGIFGKMIENSFDQKCQIIVPKNEKLHEDVMNQLKFRKKDNPQFSSMDSNSGLITSQCEKNFIADTFINWEGTKPPLRSFEVRPASFHAVSGRKTWVLCGTIQNKTVNIHFFGTPTKQLKPSSTKPNVHVVVFDSTSRSNFIRSARDTVK